LNQSDLVNRLLEPGQRANTVTIWQRPICAEHTLIGFPPDTERHILDDALEEIRASACRRIVVFDAHAFERLRAAGIQERVTYFTEALG
jgi:hypothetical protein